MKVKPPRSQCGNVIAETPPALFILFVVIFVPLLSLLALGVKYGACYSLNVLQANEASLLPASKATAAGGQILHNIPKSWKDTGIGAFVDLNQELPATEVRYEKGKMADNAVQNQFVFVKTTFALRPFLSMDTPLLSGIPGLSAPLSFVIESSRPLENPASVSK